MMLGSKVCYRAVLARDVRYDGRFFTCVKTTGIYCRPICPARPPKPENCFFVATAAAAQAAGYRSCLRCRPESSPDLDAWRGTSATVSRALRMIESGALDEGDVASLAQRLQIGERQLRRLFRQHIGANPVTVAQTRRILLARQLIHQTDLPMIDVAMASGFGSVRRFNEAFEQLYHRPPGEFRRRRVDASPGSEINLLLPYHAPYNWPAMLQFLRARAISGMERVDGETYSRVIRLEGAYAGAMGTVHVSHDETKKGLGVRVRIERLDALPAIIARLRRMFDLSADPVAIEAALSTDPFIGRLIKANPGLRIPGAWDPFEVAVRAVLGQQITVKGATRLAERIVQTMGIPLNDGRTTEGLTHAFPSADRFIDGGLSKVELIRSRAQAIENLAAAFMADPHFFDPRADLQSAVEHFCQLQGIGEWTANYISMRGLGETDAFPPGDVAIARRLKADGKRLSAAQLMKHSQRWRPWRAYAFLHLWMSEPAVVANKNKKGKSHAIAA